MARTRRSVRSATLYQTWPSGPPTIRETLCPYSKNSSRSGSGRGRGAPPSTRSRITGYFVVSCEPALTVAIIDNTCRMKRPGYTPLNVTSVVPCGRAVMQRSGAWKHSVLRCPERHLPLTCSLAGATALGIGLAPVDTHLLQLPSRVDSQPLRVQEGPEEQGMQLSEGVRVAPWIAE